MTLREIAEMVHPLATPIAHEEAFDHLVEAGLIDEQSDGSLRPHSAIHAKLADLRDEDAAAISAFVAHCCA